MVVGIAADLIQVIMLAGNTHTLLRVCGARIFALPLPEENILKLVHPGVREKEGLIAYREERRGGDNGMALCFEEFKEVIANLMVCFHVL
jgi:hypothetical protein